jgi:hypothetical protein
MEQGFAMDNMSGGRAVSHWGEGAPVKQSPGINRSWAGAKMQGEVIAIGTFRCGSCGFLESYTREEYSAKR